MTFVDDFQNIAIGMDANTSKILANSAWDTATGFETETNAALRVQALSEGMDANRSDLETHGDSNWATATEFLTSEDLNISLLDINGTITAAEIDAVLSGTHGAGSWLINDTGVVVIYNEDKTGYTLTLQDWATSQDVNISLETQAGIDNETRDWIGTLIQNSETALNNTLTLNVITLIQALNDITAADVWGYATRVLTDLTVGDQYIATQENITSVSGAIQEQVDEMINISRDIENQTRTQIIEHGDSDWITFSGTATINDTLVQEAIMESILINKTVTYNYAWDLMNVTTTYDDFGYEMVETYNYNNTEQKWYLNNTVSRIIS